MTTAFPDVPFWVQPPHRSKRCTILLDRLRDGTWIPDEDHIWLDNRKAARRARLHEWEWTNIILTAWCAQAAADPDCPWPIRRLPHCPDQMLAPADDRWKGRFLQGLCLCPEPDADRWNSPYQRVHWLAPDGGPMYCHCGHRQEPPGSGVWGGVNESGGYACVACFQRLHGSVESVRTRLASHDLKCDCRCCYCGGVAKERWGKRLWGHPEMPA